MRNGTGSSYYREVARGYRADLAAREAENAVTWRHQSQAAYFDLLAVSEHDRDALDEKLRALRELLEDWHRDVLVGTEET